MVTSDHALATVGDALEASASDLLAYLERRVGRQDAPDVLSELMVVVRDAVHRLGTETAELVRLVHWEGFSIAEAASILEISASTARSRYQRAKLRLRAELNP